MKPNTEPKTNAERQALHRARQSERFDELARLEQGLEFAVSALEVALRKPEPNEAELKILRARYETIKTVVMRLNDTAPIWTRLLVLDLRLEELNAAKGRKRWEQHPDDGMRM